MRGAHRHYTREIRTATGPAATTRALSRPSPRLSSLSGEKERIVNYQLTFRRTTKMSPIICYISVNRPLF